MSRCGSAGSKGEKKQGKRAETVLEEEPRGGVKKLEVERQ